MTPIQLAVAIVVATVLCVPADVAAQGTNPLTAGAKAQFTGISSFVTRSADKIPDNLYSFRATPEVRTIAPSSEPAPSAR